MDPSLDDSGLFKTHTVWHRQLEAIETVHDVMNTIRDYVASFTPQELARLPENRRPGRIKGDDDIEYWTYKLSRTPDSPLEKGVDQELLQEIFQHFLHASVRISQIRKARSRESESQAH